MRTAKYFAVIFLPLFFLIVLLVLGSSSALRMAAAALSITGMGDLLQPTFLRRMAVFGILFFVVFAVIQTVLVYFFFRKPESAFTREISEKLELISSPEDEKVYERVLELYKSVITDPTTGAVIYKHFTEILEKEMVRADRYKLPFSMLKITMKSKGDYEESFKKAGAIILAVLRTIDIVSINDSRDFVILLPNTKKPNADMAVRRIFRRLQQSQETTGPLFSLSIGIATYADDGLTSDVILQKADSNLQKAKMLGDNKVVF